MSDVTQEESEFCCDGMRKALETYHAPLERTLFLAKEGAGAKSYIIMWLYPATPSGRLLKSKRTWTLVPFCPFCGTQLIPHKQEAADA